MFYPVVIVLQRNKNLDMLLAIKETCSKYVPLVTNINWRIDRNANTTVWSAIRIHSAGRTLSFGTTEITKIDKTEMEILTACIVIVHCQSVQAYRVFKRLINRCTSSSSSMPWRAASVVKIKLVASISRMTIATFLCISWVVDILVRRKRE